MNRIEWQSGRGQGKGVLLVKYLVVLCTLFLSVNVDADEVKKATATYELIIPSSDMDVALMTLARITGKSIIIPAEGVSGKHTNAIRGTFSLPHALSQMLEGTGLSGGLTQSGAIFIAQGQSADAQNRERLMKSKSIRDRKKGLLASISALFFGVAGVSSVHGQEANTDNANAFSMDEIVVTGTKRDTLLQDTPAAISAFSNAFLERSVIRNTADLAAFTPGLTASTNLGGTYAIRGISSDLLSISADASVATYVDGVYLSRQTSNQIPFADIERVEVLRGPQGTVYGRNATGGVISFVTKAPSETFTGVVTAEMGNLDHIQGSAMISGPLVEDKVLFRVSASASRRDGYITNVGTGAGEGGDENYQSYRGKLLFKASDNLELTLAGDYYHQRQGFPLDQVLSLGDGGTGAILPTGKFQAAVNSDLVDTFDNRDLFGVSATVNWLVNGIVDVTSITAYRDTKTSIFTDDDATTLFQSHVALAETARTFSQEIYARNAGDSKVNYLFGGNFLSEKTGQDLTDSSPGVDVFLPASGSSRAWAVYGELSYALTDRLNINSGIRYSNEHRELSNDILLDAGAGVISLFSSPLRENSWNSVTPSFSIDYKVSEDTLLYALVAKGFKSGGFASLSTDLVGFNPETVWNYEAGLKTSLLDGRANFNVTAFYADYTDLQRRVGLSISSLRLVNAAAAKISGLELEATLKPLDAWTLFGTYAYLNAQYSDYLTVLPESITLENPDGVQTNLDGQPLERSPKHKISLISNYVVPVGETGSLELVGSVTYQSLMTFRSGRGPLYEQKGFGLVNASITYFPSDAHWSLQFYGSNLANTEHFLNKEGDPTAPARASGYSALPRTYGARLTVDF
ncbi:TonB-dependent receptor domain-containing protein [Kordiimonas pumila]|uniref:TonB-dependent receptor domain-containing protein n=1 Tax=Kordiimonas pumila TaxID=2161677 RepID=A0ABV7D5Y0_9PROT|nr:TonB-dependent receptor [Kordiimonas pumila]